MKFVNIVPTQLLDKPEYWCSEWHLILAQKLGKNKYTEKVKGLKKLGAKVILDNGIFETDKSVDLEKLVRQALDIKAQALVLPDCENYKKLSLDLEEAQGIINEDFSDVKLIAVLQGNRILRVYDMYRRLQENPLVDIVAIPDRLLRDKISSQ